MSQGSRDPELSSRALPGLTQGEVGDDTGEDEGGEEGQGQDEGVEVAVVAFAHAVAHPGAVVIEPLWNKGTGEGGLKKAQVREGPCHLTPNTEQTLLSPQNEELQTDFPPAPRGQNLSAKVQRHKVSMVSVPAWGQPGLTQ